MTDDGVYLRRVRAPNPMLDELARQILDDIDRHGPVSRDPVRNFRYLCQAAEMAGVPLAYVLDERERRARDGR